MTLARALAYFLREASINLVRSWKVSVLAVLTIGISLFIGGLFLLVGDSLSRRVEGWRSQAKVVLYLRPESTPAERSELAERILRRPWVTGLYEVSSAEAEESFAESFPGLAGLMEGWETPLPPSFEVGFDPEGSEAGEFERWLESLREEPAVEMVDDDRDWLRQIERIATVVRTVGLGLGGLLLGAATFIIASIIRLTAYLYREEIGIMRLVGATEFFIRGPFYLEGLLQGLLGGLLAVGGLYGAYAALRTERTGSLLSGALLGGGFLPPRKLAILVGLGCLAGLAGAILSLRRESLSAER